MNKTLVRRIGFRAEFTRFRRLELVLTEGDSIWPYALPWDEGANCTNCKGRCQQSRFISSRRTKPPSKISSIRRCPALADAPGDLQQIVTAGQG
jgi:hypothetical protein